LVVSHKYRRRRPLVLLQGNINITITIINILPTTTATGGTPFSTCPPQTREEQLLTMITTLQQQVNTMLLQQQESRVEVTRSQVFSGRMEEVSAFVNAACLYIRMKMTEEAAATQVAWVLPYVQRRIAEA